MQSEIKLQFYRNSRNTRKLQRIVEDFSHYELAQDYQDPCFVYINKDCTVEDLKLFNYLWDIVRKYKETMMCADDRILTKEQAEGILNWIRCYCNHEYFPDQQDYCCISPGVKHLHGWGCKWLHSVMRHGRFGRHYGVQWYKVGPFDGKVQFIDKQDIKDKLTSEAKAKGLQLCPLFSLDKAFQYVDQLPDQIDPRIDTEWEYDSSEEPESKFEVLGIRPKKIDVFKLM